MSDERPAAVSHRGNWSVSLISVLNNGNVQVKTFTTPIANHAALGEILVRMEKVAAQRYTRAKPVIQRQHVISHLLIVFCQGITEKVSRLSNVSSLSRTPENPLFKIFAWISLGNLTAKYLRSDPVLSMALAKFFIKPSFMCRSGRISDLSRPDKEKN